MADGPGIVRRVILPVVLLGLTAAGLLNTYGDSTGVQKAAAEAACGGEMCPVRMTEFTRSPFSHEYVFEVGKTGTRVEVKCARGMIFFGDYECEKKK
jgi:hypothetical protein